jgi:hypothetical protein
MTKAAKKTGKSAKALVMSDCIPTGAGTPAQVYYLSQAYDYLEEANGYWRYKKFGNIPLGIGWKIDGGGWYNLKTLGLITGVTC